MSDLRLVFGRNLKRIREQRGISAKDFASAIGVLPNYLSNMESGKTGFSPDSLWTVAEALGIEPDLLLRSENRKATIDDIPKSLVEQMVNAAVDGIKNQTVSVESSIDRIETITVTRGLAPIKKAKLLEAINILRTLDDEKFRAAMAYLTQLKLGDEVPEPDKVALTANAIGSPNKKD